VVCKSQYRQNILPFQLVNLMELLQFHAAEFCRISGILSQALTYIRCNHELNPETWGEIGYSLRDLKLECEKLELRSALAHINRVLEYINRGTELAVLERYFTEIQTRVVDDLSDRWFLHLPPPSVEFYRPTKPLFTAAVEAKFPQMSEDISEAAKCIALRRSTAAVFHLMRIMELGVQKFGDRLGVMLVQEKNWQIILDQVNAAIRKLDAKQPATKAYAEAASHLYNVKVAWRNEVMHPKQTYTDEEASAIFGNVRTFVGDLVGLI